MYKYRYLYEILPISVECVTFDNFCTQEQVTTLFKIHGISMDIKLKIFQNTSSHDLSTRGTKTSLSAGL